MFLVCGLIGWLVGGAPSEFDIPEVTEISVVGGGSVTPEYLTLLFGLSVYTSGYIAEVVRAGIQSVSFGQHEAAVALGLKRSQELRLIQLPLCHAASPEPTPLGWEPSVAELVGLIEQGTPSGDTGAPRAGAHWSPSDVSLTYSFRADGDADSARSRTDAFDEALAPEGVDLRWSEGQSNAQVHYLTLKLDWDLDGRIDDDTRLRAEAVSASAQHRETIREQARRAIGLFVERRSLQGELMAKNAYLRPGLGEGCPYRSHQCGTRPALLRRLGPAPATAGANNFTGMALRARR